MKRTTLWKTAAVLAVWAGSGLNGYAQSADATTTTTITASIGAIAQLNYGSDGEVQGFLIGSNILLSFPSNICGGLGTLGAVGNSVTYSGTATTATSGFESVMLTSFTNNTTKVTYTAPTSTSSTAYGPTSGTVKQLNYAADGSIDGFLFAATGTTTPLFIAIAARSTASLTTLLTVGASLSVIGTTSPSMSACSSTSTLETVNASSLTIGTQTIVFAGGGGNGGFGNGGPGGPGGPGGNGGHE
jgi:hypothetical protein